MASIFGPLDKRQRAASVAAAVEEAPFGFEDRADLLNDLLEDDATIFPLLACPPEVLSGVLLLLEAAVAVRLRPVCTSMRVSIDVNSGLWSSLTARDFQDLGGLTKHYQGLRTLADARDDSRAVRRLEWDPLMICAPPALRYALLATARERERLWNEHGHALGAGWAWFSAKVCRRMAASTFARWASLQHDEVAVRSLMGPLAPRAGSADEARRKKDNKIPSADADDSSAFPVTTESFSSSIPNDESPTVRFRCGRSDAVTLSFEAATDIYETVQKWHDKAHRDMMRAHFSRDAEQEGSAEGLEGAGKPLHQTSSGAFSVTPTLDAAEAAASVADLASMTAAGEPGDQGAARGQGGSNAGTPDTSRGAASRHLEEAQLRLALELSRKTAAEELGGSAAVADGAGSPGREKETGGQGEEKGNSCRTPAQSQKPGKADGNAAEVALVDVGSGSAPSTKEPAGLLLRGEGNTPAMVVYLKQHCLAERVDHLPGRLEHSIENIVNKMTRHSMWVLLYESITEELSFRAKVAAQALCASHARAFDQLLSSDISLDQERMCLPIWRSSASLMATLSRLRASSCDAELRRARCDLIRQTSLEWCDHEDLTNFLDSQLAPLELEIDHFRGMHEAQGQAHTPHVRDIGRLMFRNFCLLDSRVFRPLCLAAYALVHELHTVQEGPEQSSLLELLEWLHGMLAECDVADDHLSASQNTKDTFEELLVKPITVALERYAPWDIRGHPASDGDSRRRRSRLKQVG